MRNVLAVSPSQPSKVRPSKQRAVPADGALAGSARWPATARRRLCWHGRRRRDAADSVLATGCGRAARRASSPRRAGRPQGLFAHGQAAVGRKVHLPRQADIAAQGPRSSACRRQGSWPGPTAPARRRRSTNYPRPASRHPGSPGCRCGRRPERSPSALGPPTRPIHSSRNAPSQRAATGGAVQQAGQPLAHASRSEILEQAAWRAS